MLYSTNPPDTPLLWPLGHVPRMSGIEGFKCTPSAIDSGFHAGGHVCVCGGGGGGGGGIALLRF